MHTFHTHSDARHMKLHHRAELRTALRQVIQQGGVVLVLLQVLQ